MVRPKPDQLDHLLRLWSRISSLVNAVLVSLDDAITPAASRVLEVLDSKDDLQQVTGETISAEKI